MSNAERLAKLYIAGADNWEWYVEALERIANALEARDEALKR